MNQNKPNYCSNTRIFQSIDNHLSIKYQKKDCPERKESADRRNNLTN